MCARQSVDRVCYIAPETTRGTAGTLFKKLRSLDISFDPRVDIKTYRPAGDKQETVGVLNKSWSTASANGALLYSEIVYPLASICGAPTVTTTSGASSWPFVPLSTGTDVFKTFTIQQGDAAAAQQANYFLFDSLNMSITRDESKVSATGVAQLINNAATLAGSPTVLDLTPVSSNQWTVYIDTTFGALGTTKLTDAFMLDVKIANKYAQKWVLDASRTSWSEQVEQPYDITLDLELEFNAQTRALFDAMLTSSLPTYYLRAEAVGPAIGAANFKLTMDFAVKLVAAPTQTNNADKVLAYKFPFKAFDDSTFGGAHRYTVINTLTAL